MANAKKKWVAFLGNSIVPADVAGTDKDQKQQAGVPVRLPSDYADHVVSEQIASSCDAPKKAPAKKKSDTAAAETDAEKLKVAEQAVADAQLILAGLEEGTDEHNAAAAELKTAEQALSALTAS